MLSSYLPYITVSFMGALALSRFASNIRRYAPTTKANRYFYIAISAMAVCAMMEFLFSFHESGLITNLVFCYASEVCYSSASLVSAYFWCLCSETEQKARTVSTKTITILFSLPFWVMLLAVLTTPFTHLVFYFTPDGHYVRGLLNNPLVYLSAICIGKSGICALIRSHNPEYYLKRETFRTFFYYAVSILIAQVFQIAFGSVLPFRIIGAVFVFYLVQEHTFKQNIFVDILSDANNRTAMEKYLNAHFNGADERFSIAMIDMDNFKTINDRYGHSTGDKVITLVAKAFKLAMPEHFFFGRYGGDEFVIIGETESPAEIDDIVTAAKENIRQLSEEAGLSFCPGFSYGIARKTEDIVSIPTLIERADAVMYAQKKAHKGGR